jgi:hypothetical protein
MRSPVELYGHVFQIALAYGLAVKEGTGKKEHLQAIPFDPQTVKNGAQLIEYGKKVSDLVLDAVESLTDDDMKKEIVYTQWDNFKLNAHDHFCTYIF